MFILMANFCQFKVTKKVKKFDKKNWSNLKHTLSIFYKKKKKKKEP
jgi:hypothetical protein